MARSAIPPTPPAKPVNKMPNDTPKKPIDAPTGKHKAPRNLVSDILGVGRLAVDGTVGVTALVESMHHTITQIPLPWGEPLKEKATGLTGLVYQSVREVAEIVGSGLDGLLQSLAPWLALQGTSEHHEALVAVLNGIVGDHLEETQNPLALPMRFRHMGVPLDLTPEALRQAYPEPCGKLLIVVHGLCMNDLLWTRNGHNHGLTLAQDLRMCPIFLHYNSGLHVSVNGERFSALLEALVAQWPEQVEEVVLFGYSMGGLVVRSAHEAALRAGHVWPKHLKRWVFLGTPHHGSPLERGGNHIDWLLEKSPYAAPFSRLGKIRSAGVTDLRHGNLVHEDWEGQDRFETSEDRRTPMSLPVGVESFALAGVLGQDGAHLAAKHLGDGLVPVESALGKHPDPTRDLAFPSERQWVGQGMNHLDLLDRPDVYEQIRQWLAPST